MSDEIGEAPLITVYLKRLSSGDTTAEAPLAEAVYAQIRKTAHNLVQSGKDDSTLQATSLVNIVLIELLRIRSIEWKDREHFFRTASRLLRRRFIDHIRARRAEKRPSSAQRADFSDLLLPDEERFDEILDVDKALSELSGVDPELADLVELVYFGGCPLTTVAEMRNVSKRTVSRHLDAAQKWMKVRLSHSVEFEKSASH